MGGEADTSGKAEKPSESQEQPPSNSAAVYPDWSAFQAYYGSATTGIPPTGFFHSSIASSPQAHQYMWGAQHLIPPYGTPAPPYLAMYPHSSLYAHPSIAPGSHSFNPYTMPSQSGSGEASGPVPSATEADGKGKGSVKQSKGSLGSLNMLTGKGNNSGKTSGASNGAFSQSGESRSEGSSEGSDADSKNGSQEKAYCQQQGPTEVEASQNGTTSNMQNGSTATPAHNFVNQTAPIMTIAGGMPAVPGPTTNLNIGMDYWGGVAPSPIATVRGKLQTSTVAGQVVPSGIAVSHDNVQSEIWDERELKRQRRKQSNRESARRSRLRKQVECEELSQRVKTLDDENAALRSELNRVKNDLEQLYSENASLKERLGEISDGHEDSRSERVNIHVGLDDRHGQKD